MTEGVTLCSATLGEDGRHEPPLGPLYIASALEGLGVDVDFRDFQLDGSAHCFSGEALARCLAGHAGTVAISCFVDMLPAAVDAAQILHRARPDTRIVLGGPGPTPSARRILEAYPWISGVVRGEGEETVQDWVRLLRGQHEGPVAGMAYRHGGTLVDGPPRQRIAALDALAGPAWHLVDWSRYTNGRVITTRGCSYRCSFCDVTALWGSRSVFRGLESTVAEIEMLRDRFGQEMVAIVDDTFVLNRQRVQDFCRLLIERGSGVVWGCFGRINLMTPELIELMARAGCRGVFYGIDSGSQAVLDRTAKRVRAEDIMPVLEVSAQHFASIEASFIWGYPFETLDDFSRTLDVAAQASLLAPVVNVQLHMLSPLPMSPIYREFAGQLLDPEPEDARWLLLPAVLLDARAGRVRELVRQHPKIYPGFYTLPTPGKQEKRRQLERVMQTLTQTVGSTVVDGRTARLLREDAAEVEGELLAARPAPAERIGVGLALGAFRRVRHREQPHTGPGPLAGTRGASLVRERPEFAAANRVTPTTPVHGPAQPDPGSHHPRRTDDD
ncbi:MAG: radical SAM protein [Candidatus Latescibacterota bacterium]